MEPIGLLKHPLFSPCDPVVRRHWPFHSSPFALQHGSDKRGEICGWWSMHFSFFVDIGCTAAGSAHWGNQRFVSSYCNFVHYIAAGEKESLRRGGTYEEQRRGVTVAEGKGEGRKGIIILRLPSSPLCCYFFFYEVPCRHHQWLASLRRPPQGRTAIITFSLVSQFVE